jgi:hypothetical protein
MIGYAQHHHLREGEGRLIVEKKKGEDNEIQAETIER